MGSLRYLNTILTILAVVLSLHLWTLWAAGPDGQGPLVTPDLATEARADGIPNAGAQRKQIIDLLKLLNQRTDQLVDLFKSGKARMRFEAAPPQNDTK